MTRLTALTFAMSALALPAFAAEVNVYSTRQPELVEPLFDAFTEETGIEVNTVFLSKGLVERLKAEGRRSPADLVFTTDISRLAEVVAADLTQPVLSESMSEHVPAALHDPDGRWWGLTVRARVIYASKDRVEDQPGLTYESLTDPKWEGRICTRSGTNAYNVALTSAMIHHHGEEGAKAWLDGVKANLARKPQGNDRAQVKAIWAGECDISIGNTYYMGLMLKDEEQKAWADSVRILFPEFEDGGTHVNVSGVAMTKAAPNKENALKLMEFAASPRGQEIYGEINNEYPIAPGSTPSELVQSWGPLNADDVNLMNLAELRPTALRITEEIDFDG
ncbi:MAG: Fe(3+) ABC transporter substrate-binding protein [Mangrovicoccus sp.]